MDANKRRPSPYTAILVLTAYLFAIFAVSFGSVMPETFELSPGMPSPVSFRASRQIVNSFETQRQMEQAANAVSAVYINDANITEVIMTGLDNFFVQIGALRADYLPIYSPTQTPLLEEEELARPLPVFSHLSISLSYEQARYIITGDSATFARFMAIMAQQFEYHLHDGIGEGAALTAATVQITNSLAEHDFSQEYISIGQAIAEGVLRHNQVENEEMTYALRQMAMDEVEPIVFLAGQNIVLEGEIISQEAYMALIDLGYIGGDGTAFIAGIIGAVLIVTIVFAICIYVIYLFKKDLIQNKRQAMLLFCLFMITIGLTRAMIPLAYYFTPIMLFAMLAAILIDVRLAAILTVGVAVISAAMEPNNHMFLSYAIVNGLFAAIIAKHVVARGKILMAMVSISLVNVFSVFANYFLFSVEFSVAMINSSIFALFVGLATVLLCIGSLPFWESIFEVATQNTLLELTNPNNALLRRMAIETPGTYHHSLIVANLAETACYDIGANHVLARVGAYYHDIGKMQYPQYFAENQAGENPHDSLPPRTSVEVITDHITRGLELAKKHRLPQPITHFIEEHHGNSMMKVFYFKEKTANPDAEINENDFRYKNPRPSSPEVAIVMLADTCEAAVRSKMTREGSKIEEMDAFVRMLIKDKLEDGQLNESGLGIKDLDTAAKAFMRVFKGMYHARVPYPSGTVKELVAKSGGKTEDKAEGKSEDKAGDKSEGKTGDKAGGDVK